MPGSIDISKEDAVAALRAQVFNAGDRQLHHCFIGTMGADWDLDAAIECVEQAAHVAWACSLFFGWGLAVIPTGEHERVRFFDSCKPPTSVTNTG